VAVVVGLLNLGAQILDRLAIVFDGRPAFLGDLLLFVAFAALLFRPDRVQLPQDGRLTTPDPLP
jgi:hypothetical protein